MWRIPGRHPTTKPHLLSLNSFVTLRQLYSCLNYTGIIDGLLILGYLISFSFRNLGILIVDLVMVFKLAHASCSTITSTDVNIGKKIKHKHKGFATYKDLK